MLSRVPSWAVAVAGAAIVIAATATSTVLLHQTRADITAVKSEIDRLRLLSQTHIGGRADDSRAAESRGESLQARESWVYLAYVFFNLLGLMVTMGKDLPVWKAERHSERVA